MVERGASSGVVGRVTAQVSSCAFLLGGDGKILMNYCLFRTELGPGAHTLSWVTLLCTGMAGLGTTQLSLCTKRRRKEGTQSSSGVYP